MTRGHFIALVLAVALAVTLMFGFLAGFASVELDRWFYREGKR
jgi:hypothetical protein